MHRDQAVHLFFPPQVRRQIEKLACQPPTTVGMNILHWSTRSLELAARELELVTSIDHSTISELLRAADLQPHRFRYWKTTVWDEEAIARAIKILWY